MWWEWQEFKSNTQWMAKRSEGFCYHLRHARLRDPATRNNRLLQETQAVHMQLV